MNRLILVATAKVKAFQSSHAGKEVRHALVPLDGRKTKWKIKQPREVFSKNPVKLNIPLDLLLRGLNYDKDVVYLTGFKKLFEALKDRK